MDTPSLHHYPIKSVAFPIKYENKAIHACKPLMDENRSRQLEGDKQVFIFRDIDSDHWNMKTGSEFIRVNYCPFCAEKL